MLSHYKAVVWETGDDIIPRAAGQPGGTAARSALETELAVRDYLNEGGKLLLAGKYAGFAQGANGAYVYQPDGPAECTDADRPDLPADAERLPAVLAGRVHYVDDGGTGAEGPYPLVGTRAGSTASPGAERGRLGGQPGPHRVVPDHVELPAADAVPAVRQRGADRLGAARRGAVRPVRR